MNLKVIFIIRIAGDFHGLQILFICSKLLVFTSTPKLFLLFLLLDCNSISNLTQNNTINSSGKTN